jgi:hypothetical protein
LCSCSNVDPHLNIQKNIRSLDGEAEPGTNIEDNGNNEKAVNQFSTPFQNLT